MAVHFFLQFVLCAIAICYAAEKIIEKLQEEIRDAALQEINKYVAAQTGDYLTASIRRPLGYLLSIAGLYIAKEIAEYLVEKFKRYAVEIIEKYVVAPIRFQLNYLLCYKSNIEGFRTQMKNLEKTRDEVQRLVDAAEMKDEVILQNVREWLTNVNKIKVESRNIFEDELQLNLKLYYQLILKLYYQLNLKLYYQRSRYAKEKTADVDKLTQEGGDMLCYNRNIENFRTQMENLGNTRVEVQRLVDAAKKKGEVILLKVEKWLTSVDKIAKESRKFFGDELQSNLKLLYIRSSYAEEQTEYVGKLTREGNDFDRVYTSAAVFESRDKIFKDIMEALKDDKINMIGIYGMGGVGKTTLAKQVEQQSKDDNLFDAVVMVVVSQTPDWGKIRLKIAETLDSIVGNKGESQREGQGSTQKGESRREEQGSTKDKKRILIILDDIWKDVKLEETIEISFGMKHKGCKVMLTSRSQKVCDRMDTDKNFSVDVITDEEGWNLFRKTAGDSVDSPDLRPLAVEIASKCAGLPIAIVTVATALKNEKSSSVWCNALNNLRNSIHEKEVFAAIELSYNHLQDEEAKSFFLLCCLFPDDTDIPIRFLMMYGIGLRWFKGVNTVDKASDKAHTLAQSLKSSCLLQHSDVKAVECVKMHDVIRDFAISIASNDEHRFLVTAGVDWKGLPDEDAFKRYTAISLWSNEIDELPMELECPNLEFLVLNTLSSLQFSKILSLRMESLKVLNIFDINSLSLPQSFQNLKNLRTLGLMGCNFIDISIIGKLKNLEILSFLGSKMKELPKEIGMLSQLRLLDLIGCNKLTVIPPDVLRVLSRLEGLYVVNSFDKWEIEGKERSNASLEELNHLSRLINLEIHIPDANLWPKDLLFESLSRFRISVDTSSEESDFYSNSKILKIELDVSTGLKDGIKGLLKKVEDLRLRKMKGLKSVVYDLDREGFQDLRHLIVEECSGLEYIFNASERDSLVAFPILEKLYLNDLEKLEKICNGRLPSGFFSKLQELRLIDLPELKKLWEDPAQHVCLHNLTVVKVEDCGGLKNLFSYSEAKGLSKLVELEVRKCRMMVEIIGNEKEAASAAVDDIVFPHLRSLKLEDLPNLTNFCSKMKGDLDTSTEEPLFDKKVSFPQLKVLKVEGCHSLASLFSPSIANCLAQLKEVEILSCKMMESIIAEEKKGEENCKKIVFPKLCTLKLLYLPKLISLVKTFTSIISIQQELMTDDEIVKEAPQEGNLCDPIQPLFNEKVAFTNLEELEITNIENLQEIFHIRLADESFSQLRILRVTECDKLSRVAPSNLLPRLQNLETLGVEGCNSMEKIFELEGEGCTPISLSQLEYVRLRDLPSLLMFCSGKYDFELPSLATLWLENCPKMPTFSSGLKGTPKLKTVCTEWDRKVWKGDLNSTIHQLFLKEEIKQCLYVIKDLVNGLHSREQEISVQEDEEKDKDEEVGEKSEEANIEEQERKENISAQAVHHEISEEAEQAEHRKGSMEAISEHLKVMTNLLDELGVEEEEDDEEEEEGESEKAGEANIEELQEIREHLKEVVRQLYYYRGLHKQKDVVKFRRRLKRMMNLVDILGLHKQELSKGKLKRDISSGNEVEEGEEGNASACQGIQHKILEIEVQAQL